MEEETYQTIFVSGIFCYGGVGSGHEDTHDQTIGSYDRGNVTTYKMPLASQVRKELYFQEYYSKRECHRPNSCSCTSHIFLNQALRYENITGQFFNSYRTFYSQKYTAETKPEKKKNKRRLKIRKGKNKKQNRRETPSASA